MSSSGFKAHVFVICTADQITATYFQLQLQSVAVGPNCWLRGITGCVPFSHLRYVNETSMSLYSAFPRRLFSSNMCYL